MLKPGILRVIDANFNRSKEGLRVVEDLFRFVLEENALRKEARLLRHSLDAIAQEKIIKKAIVCRNSNSDIGRKVDCLETSARDEIDALYINFQRVKESLRVLEECFKILLPGRRVSTIKKIRYRVYSLEKKTLKKWPAKL